MTNSFPRILFILPDLAGGVCSVVNNIVSFDTQNRPKEVLAHHDRRYARTRIAAQAPDLSYQAFEYHSFNNIYHIARQFRSMLGHGQLPVVVATDSLELVMAELTRLDTKIVFMVMGDFNYYYQIAEAHQHIINGFIAISKEIELKLVERLPHRKKDIHCAYFPTPAVDAPTKIKPQGPLRVIFVGRLEEAKNPLQLLEIDRLLKQQQTEVQWTIVGEGSLKTILHKETQGMDNFNFTGNLSNERLLAVYAHHEVFIMPSKSEGLPVSLVEAMKNGLVPVVSKLKGGIQEVVIPEVNGFLCEVDDTAAFARGLSRLAQELGLFEKLSGSSKHSVDRQFDPWQNSRAYFEIIDVIPYNRGTKRYTFRPTNRLDKDYIPSLLTKSIRMINDKFRIS